jgi:RNA polymerase sigma-70 factor, ECF subfamily
VSELTLETVTTTKDSVGCDCQASARPMTDLVERARTGDQASFRELFHLHAGRIHRTVYRLAGPSADIEDLVQTVFIDGFRSLPSFRGEALFSTWLTRIAVRVALRARKPAAARMVSLDAAGLEPVGNSDPASIADARRGLARLDAILAELSAKRRSAFVLHVLEGHSLEDVAAMLGASVAAIKVRVHDARGEIERRARRDPWFVAFLGMGDES